MRLSKTGNYFYSRFTSTGNTLFNPKRSKRFKDLKAGKTIDYPGPGAYSPKNETAKDGTYFLSTIKSNGARTFYHSNRITAQVSKEMRSVPGPGMYKLPSDFGYYEDRSKYPAEQAKRRRNLKMNRRANSVESIPRKDLNSKQTSPAVKKKRRQNLSEPREIETREQDSGDD